MFTEATEYIFQLVLKVGLENVFERYAERVFCHAIQHHIFLVISSRFRGGVKNLILKQQNTRF